MKYLSIDDVEAFKVSEKLANTVWKLVIKWDYFSKKTVGEQMVRSFDSISANIAEGFGRYFKKDKIKFYYYSRGSLTEARTWLSKAFKRKLISESENELISKDLEELPREINFLIKITSEKLSI